MIFISERIEPTYLFHRASMTYLHNGCLEKIVLVLRGMGSTVDFQLQMKREYFPPICINQS